MRAYYHPQFEVPLGTHIMPIQKFSLIAQALHKETRVELVEPTPLDEDELLTVHTQDYINAIKTGEPRSLAESQKFPWSEHLYTSVLLTNGAVKAAAYEALESGSAAAVASGFHHAHKERGEGFCTFNGLVLAAESLYKNKSLKKIAILDMDLHYGNGTAQLAVTRPWLQVLSLYGNDYWNNTAYRDVTELHHEDGRNHKSYALKAGLNGKELLQIMEEQVPFLLENQKPDLLLYQAGADPFYKDPYSPLALTEEDLYQRDLWVFKFAHQNKIPIAWTLAGGYTEDIREIVNIHLNTFQAWMQIYGSKIQSR